ncbi:MAG: Tm-1-like ATP-binding domain-containing protein [Lachnospiraceae bacterium]|nr:Tm-1-like ATP-binding domain-containing protein [Lachnospiraceae bacterium]
MNDRKTIAVIMPLDTKLQEAMFAADMIRESGCEPLLIDNSTKNLEVGLGSVTPEEILRAGGTERDRFEEMDKPHRIIAMTEALAVLLPQLCLDGRIDGALSVGGGQTGNMAGPAMKALPFGFPKVLASSLACGVRMMEQYVGEKDIFVVPTVADIAGLNPVTMTLIRNVCSAAAGMVRHGRVYRSDAGHRIIGATMLGETSRGTQRALELIREKTDLPSVVFHANGVGGRSMESLIEAGQIQAVLDMTLHEIVCEVYGGYCSGAKNRLLKALEYNLPTLVVPGGLDMNDYFIDEAGSQFPPDIDKRKKVHHNPTIYHAKVWPEEGAALAKLVCERLGTAKTPVTLVVPTRGLCETSSPGGPIWDPETDEAMVRSFKENVRPGTKLVTVDAAINDPLTAQVVADEFEELIGKYGWLWNRGRM